MLQASHPEIIEAGSPPCWPCLCALILIHALVKKLITKLFKIMVKFFVAFTNVQTSFSHQLLRY